MNNKIKWLEMSFSYMEKTKKYAKANVIFRLRILFFRLCGMLFPYQDFILISNQIEFSTAGKVISILFAQGTEADVACLHWFVEHHFLWFTATF